MKKKVFAIVLLMLAFTCAAAAGQTPQPTQTPYIIYVVVTPTPEDIIIRNPAETESEITIVNRSGENAVSIVNETESPSSGVSAADDLVAQVVATLMAQANTTAGGTDPIITKNNTSAGSGVTVRQSDGSVCTMDFELVSEPAYPAGSLVARGAVFWKEWVLRNTGTCTWTPAWSFVFDSGWQIGNTRFSMNRTTAPGETLTVRLGMTPDQKQNGNYYSTYVFEAPDGTRGGKITSSYTVKNPSYFDPKPTVPPEKMKPQPGSPAGPIWTPPYCGPGWYCPPYYPYYPYKP